MPKLDPQRFDKKEILFEKNYYDVTSSRPYRIYTQQVNGKIKYIAVCPEEDICGTPQSDIKTAVADAIACRKKEKYNKEIPGGICHVSRTLLPNGSSQEIATRFIGTGGDEHRLQLCAIPSIKDPMHLYLCVNVQETATGYIAIENLQGTLGVSTARFANATAARRALGRA